MIDKERETLMASLKKSKPYFAKGAQLGFANSHLEQVLRMCAEISQKMAEDITSDLAKEVRRA